MIYRDFQDIKLSALGYGAMRLPVIDGDDGNIDREKAEKLIDRAMSEGINYYDTAYGYHNGQSEIILGEILSKYPKDSYYFADKFPGYDLSNMPKVKEIFEEQLRKTGREYFDFYLFHNVCEMNIDAYLDPKYGIAEFLFEQKKNKRIRHLGFSCHGEPDTLRRFLDAYGDQMEFCQLQLNYLDWSFQHGKEKVELLNERKIPVWVMEPLRGGKLAKTKPGYEERLKKIRPDESIPAMAFRFLQGTEGVTLVLSGMTKEEQLSDNLNTFSEDKPFDENELKELMGIAEDMLSENTVPCTACHYCVSHCPQGLDIPRFISLYNEHFVTIDGGGWDFIAPMALAAIEEDKRPAKCLHCRSCEQVCPQKIKISEIMTDFVKQIG